MILSDVDLREAIAAGRIGIDPFDESAIQPSSIDVRVDSLFRVFRNHTAAVIDVKHDLRDLTELVEIARRRGVHAPPRRVRPRVDARTGAPCPTTSWRASRASRPSAGSDC